MVPVRDFPEARISGAENGEGRPMSNVRRSDHGLAESWREASAVG